MISIIVPTLNEEKIIEKTLRNLKEYGGDFELIVSDGGSRDRTVEIARRYADKVEVYRGEKRQTIAMGRNLGAAQAQGDLLLFLDADVYIPEPDVFFSKALHDFENDQSLVGLLAFLKVFPELATLADRFIFSMVNHFVYLFDNIFHQGDANGGEFQIIRRSAFEQVGGYDEMLVVGEANNLFWRLSKIGKVRINPQLTVYHTSRRAHKIGWLKLYWLWAINVWSVVLRKKSYSKVWEDIR